ncbi:MAG TPA: GGDEF domain-containing protein [bacterium]|nr:GGDEF domain-containing protein [bacterium]HPP30275.1 GGDEF domain-containing protein [bacterium]
MKSILRDRIFIITEFLLYIVVTVAIILTAMWVEPIATFKYALRIIIPFLLITYFFLFLVFRIIRFYYHSLLQQKNFIELLNIGLIRLGTHIKIDAILRESLDIFLNFYGGDRGIILIIGDRIKEYTSGDILTVNVSKENKHTGELNRTYSIFTFSPASISGEIDKKIKQSLQEYDFGKCREVIILPVGDRKKINAVVIIGISDSKKKNKHILFEETKNEMDIFLRHLNIEIENAILHEEINKASITDALTGLYNRRYFKKRLEQEFARAKRVGFPISIMISDLDNFKYYVDRYGHPKGDQILSEIGSLIKSTVRESDVACRFGGDEFAYLLPFTSSDEAKILAERIRKNVSKYEFLKGDVEKAINLTMSIGIATFPEHGQSDEEIISKADQALFASKSAGKNRITIYKEE